MYTLNPRRCRLFPLLILLCLPVTALFAQGKLSIDKVYTAYLQSSGPIMEKGQVKGYFFLYQSDKIDKTTNEYTLQILDENLNRIKSIKFDDSKDISLLEAAYNGSTIAFLFRNEEGKTLDLKVYDFSGKLKYTYSNELDKRSEEMIKQFGLGVHGEAGGNRLVFDIGERGYVSVTPLKDGKARTYQVDIYSSQSKKQWSYLPADDQGKFSYAEYLGCTDSLVVLQVFRANNMFGNDATSHIVGINFVTRKKQFDIKSDDEKNPFAPTNIVAIEGTHNLMAIGPYFEKENNPLKDASKGLEVCEITTTGQIVSKTLNSWAGDFSKFLPINNAKGKIDGIGYLYIHKVIRTPDQRTFIVGEGYKREASALGIATTLMGHYNGVTKIVITDLVIMEFDDHFKVQNATVYDKTNNTAVAGSMSDINSQHGLAVDLKAMGAFDYEFTTGEDDNSNFAVCYSDWVRSSDYKGQTFNSIRYNGKKFISDKIELKSKATSLRVLPGKAGTIMIIEYFKKDKRLELRLEKLG
ncbi:DUF6770 family protein [Puia sp. P3]|uniref:DUF6770 family protein n=1 Tax=Puia sp. P3 TaxID=3423952 RepID=UPI003D6642E9